MNDDRLLSALKRLGAEELPTATDRAIRGRLETAWTARARKPAGASFSVRRFAPVLAAFVLVAGFGGSVLDAGADSPLWDTRVALEAAGAFLRVSNDDRVAYLLDLVQSRTEEAARQDAAGHPEAAARARVAAAAAVVELDGNIPQIDTTLPLPTATPSQSPAPTPATPTPSASRPVPTPAPTPTRIVTPTGTPVRTATPSPSVTAKPMVTITGTVNDQSGAKVTDACITTSPTFPTSTTSCLYKTKSGSYGFSTQASPGQAITLYAYWIGPTGQQYQGSSSSTIVAPTTLMPSITLTLRR